MKASHYFWLLFQRRARISALLICPQCETFLLWQRGRRQCKQRVRRSNGLTGGWGSAGADNQELASVICRTAACQLARAHVTHNLPLSAAGIYVSSEWGVESLIRSPNHPHCGMRRRRRHSHLFSGRLYFGSTSVLRGISEWRQRPCGGGRVCAVQTHYFCLWQTTTPHLLRTGFICGKYCMHFFVCQ